MTLRLSELSSLKYVTARLINDCNFDLSEIQLTRYQTKAGELYVRAPATT